MAQLSLTVDKARNLLDDEVGIDYERLVQLSIQGLFCKQLYRRLYAETANGDVCQNPPTFTTYLPLASTSGKECLAIGWTVSSAQPSGILNKMPWLAGLVYKFCDPDKIWTSTAMAGEPSRTSRCA